MTKEQYNERLAKDIWQVAYNRQLPNCPKDFGFFNSPRRIKRALKALEGGACCFPDFDIVANAQYREAHKYDNW